MIQIIDNLLNKITMYRLVLYYLILLLIAACVYSLLHVLHFSITSLLISVGILLITCIATNTIFARVYNAPTNNESAYITALILTLIITPIQDIHDLPTFIGVGVLAMASKYILAIHKKHVFNPVAIAIVLTTLGFNGVASWWIGTVPMLPFVLIGYTIIRKLRIYRLFLAFTLAACCTTILFDIMQGTHIALGLHDLLITSSFFFFGFVMITEPLTTPPTRFLQTIYGAMVGILFTPAFHIASWYTTPEIALIIGNGFSYIVSPKFKLIATLKEKIESASGNIEFLFAYPSRFTFKPGQYIELTLPHKRTDSRGNRRFFTLASSPTESTLRLGVKFYSKGSSFKSALQSLSHTTPVVINQVSGEFTLPKNKKKKLVFIAGGIGITPFRSMIKFLIDTHEKRSILLFYSNKKADEIMYQDIFQEAQEKLGIRTMYTLTDTKHIPASWQGSVGRISAAMIKASVPDYLDRMFYLSGPNVMIHEFETMLNTLGIAKSHIKKDFFPGF